MIYLPPPKPPVATKRETEDGIKTAMAPAATPGAPGQSRQARRKAMREEAKAQRRLGQPPAAKASSARPSPSLAREAMAEAQAREVALVATPEPAALETPEPAVRSEPQPQPEPPAAAPLPRGQSLTTAKPGALALFARRLRGWFVVERKRTPPAERAAVAHQLRDLRAELATLQQSLDRIIDSVAA